MAFDLTKLGWKAFQDLATAVAAEILKRPVQTFLGSKDGGRDGAFLGTWNRGDGEQVKSTLQCKYLGKAGAHLTLSHLKDELPKAAQLVKDGLAEDYVILTNAGVSGEADKATVLLAPVPRPAPAPIGAYASFAMMDAQARLEDWTAYAAERDRLISASVQALSAEPGTKALGRFEAAGASVDLFERESVIRPGLTGLIVGVVHASDPKASPRAFGLTTSPDMMGGTVPSYFLDEYRCDGRSAFKYFDPGSKQPSVEEIKALIEDSVGKVDAGGRLVDEAGKTMDEIVSSVKRVTDIMGEIAAASQEQSAGIEQVSQAITQMDNVTQQNSALVEEAAAAAESLQDQAGKLAEAVSVFRLEGGSYRPQAERPALENRAAAKPRPARMIAPPKKVAAGGGSEEWEEF